jgi:hypothetical protein
MRQTVLLVDDSVTQSFALKLALQRAGFPWQKPPVRLTS